MLKPLIADMLTLQQQRQTLLNISISARRPPGLPADVRMHLQHAHVINAAALRMVGMQLMALPAANDAPAAGPVVA